MKTLEDSDLEVLKKARSAGRDARRSGLSLDEELALGEVMDAARAALLVAIALSSSGRDALRATLAETPKALRIRQGEDAQAAMDGYFLLLQRGTEGVSAEKLEAQALDLVARAVLQENLQLEIVEDLEKDLAAKKRGGRGDAWQCLRRGREAFDLARTRLVNENVPLARMLAAQHAGRGVALDDLFQEACAGLLRAVDRYDYRRGLRFNTYAVWWIRSTLRLSVLERGRLVHVPLRQLQALNRLRRAEARWRNLNDGEPPLDELAREAGVEPSDIESLRRLPRGTTSLDLEDDDGPAGGMHERLAASDGPSPDEEADRVRLKQRIRDSLQHLSSRDALVVRMRYGIDCRPHTLAEVGEFLGVTRERARQLEARALGRLRESVAA